MIKNIFWSMDGTLFDTYPAITHAFSKSMTELGFPVALNVIDRLVRKSLDQCVESLSLRFKVEPSLLRLCFEEHYRQLAPANQAPFHGVWEVCTYIYRQGGLNVVVAQCCQKSAQQLIAAHGFDPLFAGIVSLEKSEVCRPIPAMFETALQGFGLDRDSTLVVSNQDVEIQAGSAVGLRTCLYGRAALSEPADYQIDSYDQLQRLLEEMPA